MKILHSNFENFEMLIFQFSSTIIALFFIIFNSNTSASSYTFTNSWAIKLKLDVTSSKIQINQIASKYGFVYKGYIIQNFYLFVLPTMKSKSKRKAKYGIVRIKELLRDTMVISVNQQIAQKIVSRRDFKLQEQSQTPIPPGCNNKTFDRTKRHLTGRSQSMNPNDPEWKNMWYLTKPDGLNIIEAWNLGVTGRGIVVSVLDDGLETSHPDLKINYDPMASYDMNNNDPDPTPNYNSKIDDKRHGTKCAGEIAAAFNNSNCIVGVAYNAKIGGIKLLDGDVTDSVASASLSYNRQHIDIYSNSWGPDDGGSELEAPKRLTSIALKEGVELARSGKGSIFVWASGNGGQHGDNCNCDGYASSIYTLTISATTEKGNIPIYSEICSATFAVTYSSGGHGEQGILTTDIKHKCMSGHNATSAAAPIAAAICALTLGANPLLTWRDIQHIVVRTARPSHLNSSDWHKNGVGRWYSNWFGFGLMDAAAMVQLARKWTGSAKNRFCTVENKGLKKSLKENTTTISQLTITKKTTMCMFGSKIVSYLEHVQVMVVIDMTGNRGDLSINLTSPAGTSSRLMTNRPKDHSKEGFAYWPLTTVHMWGEKPEGVWKLSIGNIGCAVATLHQWDLKLWGTDLEVGPQGVKPTSQKQQSNIDLFCCSFSPLNACSACTNSRALFRGKCVTKCPEFYRPVSDKNFLFKSLMVTKCRRIYCELCQNLCSKCKSLNASEKCSGNCMQGWKQVEGVCLRS